METWMHDDIEFWERTLLKSAATFTFLGAFWFAVLTTAFGLYAFRNTVFEDHYKAEAAKEIAECRKSGGIAVTKGLGTLEKCIIGGPAQIILPGS